MKYIKVEDKILSLEKVISVEKTVSSMNTTRDRQRVTVYNSTIRIRYENDLTTNFSVEDIDEKCPKANKLFDAIFDFLIGEIK